MLCRFSLLASPKASNQSVSRSTARVILTDNSVNFKDIRAERFCRRKVHGHIKRGVIKHSFQKLCKPRTVTGFATSLGLSLPLTNSSIEVEFDLIRHCPSPGGARAWLVKTWKIKEHKHHSELRGVLLRYRHHLGLQLPGGAFAVSC